MARLTHRVEKLEAMTDMSDRRFVIPLHSFYAGTKDNCTCRPYYTHEPFVICKGMEEFYAQVDKCPTPPEDAEFVDGYFEAKETV